MTLMGRKSQIGNSVFLFCENLCSVQCYLCSISTPPMAYSLNFLTASITVPSTHLMTATI